MRQLALQLLLATDWRLLQMPVADAVTAAPAVLSDWTARLPAVAVQDRVEAEEAQVLERRQKWREQRLAAGRLLL